MERYVRIIDWSGISKAVEKDYGYNTKNRRLPHKVVDKQGDFLVLQPTDLGNAWSGHDGLQWYHKLGISGVDNVFFHRESYTEYVCLYPMIDPSIS